MSTPKLCSIPELEDFLRSDRDTTQIELALVFDIYPDIQKIVQEVTTFYGDVEFKHDCIIKGEEGYFKIHIGFISDELGGFMNVLLTKDQYTLLFYEYLREDEGWYSHGCQTELES